jgi:hypothetical protein
MRVAWKRWSVRVVMVVAGVVFAIPGSTQDRANSLVMSGDPPSLILMYTGDVIGFIEPCG